MAADDLKTLIQRAALDPDDKTALDELARALHRAGYGVAPPPPIKSGMPISATMMMHAKIEATSWNDPPPKKPLGGFGALISAAMGEKKKP
jgi:hypothetical protein